MRRWVRSDERSRSYASCAGIHSDNQSFGTLVWEKCLVTGLAHMSNSSVFNSQGAMDSADLGAGIHPISWRTGRREGMLGPILIKDLQIDLADWLKDLVERLRNDEA